ncbi:MAG: DUF1778 domain-containing protein [Desulfuromonadales bacterium]|nr:DUF1778 domain-containing protein [Desulfuromonadales bacterium]
MTATALKKTAEEKLTSRITTRVTENVHSVLSEAATLVGSTVNQFVVQSAVEKARSVIENDRFVLLSSQASKRFIEALDNPPKANKKLKAAFHAHKEHL